MKGGSEVRPVSEQHTPETSTAVVVEQRGITRTRSRMTTRRTGDVTVTERVGLRTLLFPSYLRRTSRLPPPLL